MKTTKIDDFIREQILTKIRDQRKKGLEPEYLIVNYYTQMAVEANFPEERQVDTNENNQVTGVRYFGLKVAVTDNVSSQNELKIDVK